MLLPPSALLSLSRRTRRRVVALATRKACRGRRASFLFLFFLSFLFSFSDAVVPRSLDKKEVDQLTKQTHWTKEDLAALHADFKAADVKKTGELDFSQFVSIMKGRITMDEAGYKNLFTHMDTDNSGTISFQELATNLSVVGKGSADEKLAFTFDLYDDDKSGYLDRQEAEQVLKQMQRVAATLGRTADDFIVGLLEKLDQDKDGKITRAEWMEVGAKTPSLLVLLGVRKV